MHKTFIFHSTTQIIKWRIMTEKKIFHVILLFNLNFYISVFSCFCAKKEEKLNWRENLLAPYFSTLNLSSTTSNFVCIFKEFINRTFSRPRDVTLTIYMNCNQICVIVTVSITFQIPVLLGNYLCWSNFFYSYFFCLERKEEK